MADKVQQYIKASDNASDYADAQAAKLEQQALEDIDDLSRDDTNRDLELWEAFGVNPELVVVDYDVEPVQDRGIDWVLGLAGIYAASRTQFYLDNREDLIINPSAYRRQKMSRFDMTQAELVEAGKRGFEIEGVEEFESIRTESYEGLSELNDLDNVELYEALLVVEAIRLPEQSISNSAARVQRLAPYPGGSVQWKEGTADVVEAESKRELTAMTRRSLAGIYTARKLADDLQLMVWIGEGGKNTCSNCLANFGDVDTYENWMIRGRPGAEVCRGGDSCRCNLEPV